MEIQASELPAVSNEENALGTWREARQATEALHENAEKFSAECDEQQKRRVDLISAHTLAKAGFKLQPKEFELPENATSASEQETAARFALEETTAAISDRLSKLDPFMAALRQRVILALARAQTDRNVLNSEGASEVVELVRLLAAVGAEMPRTHEIGSKLGALLLLAQNRGNHSDPADVDKATSGLAADLQSLIGGIQERLQQFPYPFPHARGQLTVAEYARFEKPVESDLQRVYLDGNSHVDRLLALHYRIIGRVLAVVEAGEKSLEKQ